MNPSTDLTEQQWQIAHTMAIALVKTDTDHNEVSKALAYLRAFQHQEDAGKNFLNYLTILAKNGNIIGHSKKTSDYLKNLEDSCNQYLREYQNNAPEMMLILGWTIRLMRYYKTEPVAEFNQPDRTNIVPKKTAIVPEKQYNIGQIIDANIASIKKPVVTFFIIETEQKFSNKEPKHYQNLQPDQKVKVEITDIKEDGTIKKIKYLP